MKHLEILLYFIFIGAILTILYFVDDTRWLSEPASELTKGELLIVIALLYAFGKKNDS